MATRELSLCLACFGLGTNIWPVSPAPVCAEGSAPAGSPPASSAPPSPSPPPPSPSPAPRRRKTRAPRPAALVTFQYLAYERCVRRLAAFPEEEPYYIFRISRVKCDYYIQIRYKYKRVYLTLIYSARLPYLILINRFISSADFLKYD
jgi:hypothetical protein